MFEIILRSRKFSIFFIYLTALFVLSISGATADTWESYRNLHPFHIQEIAISKENNGVREIVISEPPAHFPEDINDIDQILELAFGPGTVEEIEVRRHWIMLDGWVEDITAKITSPKTYERTEADLENSIAWLSRYLFGTSYGAYYRDLDQDEAFVANGAPESLSVTPTELYKWLIKERTVFQNTHSSRSGSLSELLDNRARGTYRSKDGRLVAWIVDPGNGFTHSVASNQKFDWLEREDFRVFTLESDVILGAVRDSATEFFAVIGQARTVPYDSLPPLRYEVVRRLAAASSQDRSLAQSYERNHAFSAKISHGQHAEWDWAPILLSDHLQNTEFGSLLNITDQLLKSWSMSGDIDYFDFRYPKPDQFPFGGRLYDKMKEEIPETDGVLFNWNTAGAASLFAFEGYDVISVLRTGSLPITYGAGSNSDLGTAAQMVAFEEEGWDYFSRRQDPNLTRVVQYTFLYQIFEEWKVAHDDVFDASVLPSKQISMAFQESAESALPRIAQFDLSERGKKMLQKLSPDARSGARESIESLSRAIERFVALAPDSKDALLRGIASPRSIEIDFDSPEFQELAISNLFSYGDAEDFLDDSLALLKSSRKARQIFAGLIARDYGRVVGLFVDEVSVLRASIESAAGEPEAGNVKTPSVVLSRDRGPSGGNLVGGHNLDSAIPRISRDSSVPRGSVKVDRAPDGEIEITVHPRDLDRASGLGRAAARSPERDPQRLASELAGRFDDTPVRVISKALSRSTPLKNPALGALRQVKRAPDAQMAAELKVAKAQAAEIIEGYGGSPRILLTRLPNDTFLVSVGRPPGHQPFATQTASVEWVQRHLALGKHGQSVAFKGVTRGQTDALARSIVSLKSDPTRAKVSAGSGGGNGPKGPSGGGGLRVIEGGEGPRRLPFRIVTRERRDEVANFRPDLAELSGRANNGTASRTADVNAVPQFVRAEIPASASTREHFVVNFTGVMPGKSASQSMVMGVLFYGKKVTAHSIALVNRLIGKAAKSVPQDATLKSFARRFRDEVVGEDPAANLIMYFNVEGGGWTMYSNLRPPYSRALRAARG